MHFIKKEALLCPPVDCSPTPIHPIKNRLMPYQQSSHSIKHSQNITALNWGFVCVCVFLLVCVINETDHSTYFSSPLIGWCSCKHPSLPPSPLPLPNFSPLLTVTLRLTLLIGHGTSSFHPSMAPSQWGDWIGFLLDKRLLLGCRGGQWRGGGDAPVCNAWAVTRSRDTFADAITVENFQSHQVNNILTRSKGWAQTGWAYNRLSVTAL